MKPITRYERYLAYLGSDEDANGIDSPVTRIEQYLAKIAGQDVPIPEKPILRIEQYLAKIAGEDVAIPEKPLSRVEMYLATIAGEDIEVPEPITREEWYLAQWAENGSGVLKTVSGAIVHITDALAKPAKKFVATLEPVQSGSGDPAPDNVRPITGFTGCEVYATGKNILNMSGRTVYSGDNFAQTDTVDLTTPMVFEGFTNGYLRSGNKPNSIVYGNNNSLSFTTVTAWYGIGFNVPVIPETAYILSRKSLSSGAAHQVSYYTNESKFISNTIVQSSGKFTTPSNAHFAIIYVNAGTVGAEVSVEEFQLEFGSTARDYEDGGCTTIPITFPDAAGTVYGCTLTNEGGEWKLNVTDEQIASYNGEALPSTWISDRDVYASGTTPTIGAQVVYKLATPVTYTLTESQALTLLAGENNIWCDASDDLELKYLAEKI